MRLAIVLLAGALGACNAFNPSAKVSDSQSAEIEAAVTKEHGYREPLKFIGEWHASGEASNTLTCGEFASTPEFAGNPTSIRFLYELDRKHVTIEMHRLWATQSILSQAMIEGNRRVFDKLWEENCAPFKPF